MNNNIQSNVSIIHIIIILCITSNQLRSPLKFSLWPCGLKHTPFFSLVNLDMYCPGSACRGTHLPPGRILYIHAYILIMCFYLNLNGQL